MSRRLHFVFAAAVLLIGSGGAGCAHRSGGSQPNAATPGNAVTHLEMEPIKITAINGPDGIHVESFDAADLFDQASKALAEKRFDDAIALYDRVLKEFPDSRYTRAALYNSGLAHQGKKDWNGAIAQFKALANNHAESADAKDALFQLGATYAEAANWAASLETLGRVLERKDLSADDRLEGLGRRGYAYFQTGDLDAAERAFRSSIAYFKQIEAEERLETDFYLALAYYHLGQISHTRFRAVKLRLPDVEMSKDLDEKARLLLTAQRQYIDTIKLGNPQWASASGFQIGSLYEELYDSFTHAPVPPELLRPDAREKREVYYEQLRKKIRVLLEKSVRTHEANLLMMERLGVQNEWRQKSKTAYAKIQQLLDPSYRPPQIGADGADLASAGSPETPPPAAPPVPRPSTGSRGGAMPSGSGAGVTTEPPVDSETGAGSKPADGVRDPKRKPRPNEVPIRQIL